PLQLLDAGLQLGQVGAAPRLGESSFQKPAQVGGVFLAGGQHPLQRGHFRTALCLFQAVQKIPVGALAFARLLDPVEKRAAGPARGGGAGGAEVALGHQFANPVAQLIGESSRSRHGAPRYSSLWTPGGGSGRTATRPSPARAPPASRGRRRLSHFRYSRAVKFGPLIFLSCR